MALKYWLEFTDVKKIKHRLEILNDDFVGSSTQIYGSCTLTKESVKNNLEVIRSGGLKIDLEASIDLTLEDLYSEIERTFEVKYYRDNQIIFNGWLDTDGLYQSYVTNKWQISLTATDGLGYLENLSYVDNTTQDQITGKQKQINIIANCLKRTNIDLDIYSNIDIKYFGSDNNTSILNQAVVNNFRYVKDNGEVMNCLEVLRSVLELYTACITQKNGVWYIFRPNDLAYDTDRLYFKFDSDGIPLSPVSEYIDISQSLGSDIDNFYPHHLNGNQQIKIDSSIGAYRINYKYGATNYLYENVLLENVGGVIDEWTINDATKLTFPTDNRGFILSGNTRSTKDLIITSDDISTAEGNILVHKGKIIFSATGTVYGRAQFNSKVILTDGTDTRYLNKNGTWSTDSNTYISFITDLEREYNYDITTNGIPFDGDVYIELYTPEPISFGNDYNVKYTVLESTFVLPDDFSNIDGELHTFQRISNPSTKIAETKEVYNGDSESDLYVGNIFEVDGITLVQNWNTFGADVNYNGNIIEIMGKEKMKMLNKPTKVFKTDVFGYIDFLSVITINNIDGLFMPIDYEYNCKTNVCKLKLKEILNNDVLSDIDYNIEYYSGEVPKPTIK